MFIGKTSDSHHTRHWNKNRHMKPCKFYQTMSCPLSADVCDFAHVLLEPTPPIRIDNASCRYYQAGYCANGAWCRYTHSLDASPALSGAMNGMWISSREGPRRRSSSHTGPPLYVPTDRGVISMHVPVAANVDQTPGPPTTSANLPSPPPSNSFSNLRYHSTTVISANFTDLVDDVYACTEDPQMSEHSHSHQSRIHIADSPPLVHVPPYPNPLPIGPMSPQYHIAPHLYMLEPNLLRYPLPSKKHKRRGISKKKLERYKTKPCKFFCNMGMCPNGDSCTFIHDEDPQLIKRVSFYKNQTEVVDDGESNSSTAVNESAKLSSNEQRFCRVGTMAISTREEESSSNDSSGSDSSSSESDYPTLEKKKTQRRTRANSIPSRPTASGQMNMDNLFPAESPAIL